MDLTANLNGLTVESTSGVNVLEPFDAFVTYSKVTEKQNIHVRMTEIYTNFSFSILHLILRLQDDVMSVMRITSEQKTLECSEFEKIWADDGEISTLQVHVVNLKYSCLLFLLGGFQMMHALVQFLVLYLDMVYVIP